MFVRSPEAGRDWQHLMLGVMILRLHNQSIKKQSQRAKVHNWCISVHNQFKDGTISAQLECKTCNCAQVAQSVCKGICGRLCNLVEAEHQWPSSIVSLSGQSLSWVAGYNAMLYNAMQCNVVYFSAVLQCKVMYCNSIKCNRFNLIVGDPECISLVGGLPT